MSQNNIKRNVMYSTFYQILGIITPFITAPYISRVLGATGIGIQSFTSSVQAYFLLFAALGTASYGAREISRNRDSKKAYSKIFWEIELLTIGTAGITLVIWLLLCIFGGIYRIFYIVMIPNIIASMFDISWLFNGLEKFKQIVVINSVFKILGIVLLFVLIKKPDDLLLYIEIQSIIMVITSLSLWIYIPKFIERPKLKSLKIIPHLRQTLIYFVPTIATSIYTILDKIYNTG